MARAGQALVSCGCDGEADDMCTLRSSIQTAQICTCLTPSALMFQSLEVPQGLSKLDFCAKVGISASWMQLMGLPALLPHHDGLSGRRLLGGAIDICNFGQACSKCGLD